MRPSPAKRRVLVALLIWLLATSALVLAVSLAHPVHRAVILMGWGLILCWVVLGGALTYRYRDAVRVRVRALPWPWPVAFVVFCTVLALIEEAITTTMTNCAPLFGVPIGAAYITASANYLDVVTLHSVVVFVPMFVGWAVILSRYAFSPFMVFLLFGVTGVLAEMSFGVQHLVEFALWIFVYGLMVYLPAYSVLPRPGTCPPKWHHAVLAVFFPLLFVIPMIALVRLIVPVHPDIHFPPIR